MQKRDRFIGASRNQNAASKCHTHKFAGGTGARPLFLYLKGAPYS